MLRASNLFPAVLALVLIAQNGSARAQSDARPQDNVPNPYRTIDDWAQLPEGRVWGATSAIGVDPDGNIWVADRCAANSCAGSDLPPMLKFDPEGRLLASFGAGMFARPHGMHIDRDGNIWVADDTAADGKGHQVFKFSPEGEILMTLGEAGVAGDGPNQLNRPSDVVLAPNGDIFVADGHGGDSNDRIVHYSPDGTFIKAWGYRGAGPGEFNELHAVAFDSQGRLFVADRENNRIQIFDRDGNFLAEWKQFGRPSGLAIDANDTLYVADAESSENTNPGWTKGIWIGNARDGSVTGFIPGAPASGGDGLTAPEDVAVDTLGNLYGAEVAARTVKKFVRP